MCKKLQLTIGSSVKAYKNGKYRTCIVLQQFDGIFNRGVVGYEGETKANATEAVVSIIRYSNQYDIPLVGDIMLNSIAPISKETIKRLCEVEGIPYPKYYDYGASQNT